MATFKNFTIGSEIVVAGVKFPNTDAKDKTKHVQHKVHVTSFDTKKAISFDYFGSHVDWEKGIDKFGRANHKNLSDEELMQAFYSLLLDSTLGDMTFDDFCSDCGYDTDSRKALSVYLSCQEQLQKCKLIGLQGDKLYDTLNELQELGY